MGKAEIYNDIIMLSATFNRFSKQEIKQKLEDISKKALYELYTVQEYNKKAYHSNPYKKELKAIANSKTAIKKAFKSRHNWKNDNKQIHSFYISKRQIKKHIAIIRINQYLISKG